MQAGKAKTPRANGVGDTAPAAEHDTRTRILRAALQVVGDDGIAAVTNRRLARESGVALGSLTYHFPSQTELLRECMALFVEGQVEKLGEIAAAIRDSARSPDDVIQTVAHLAAEMIDTSQEIAGFELHLQAARDPAVRDASLRCFEAYDQIASAALEQLRVPNAERYAPGIVAMLTGAALRRIATQSVDAEAMAASLGKFFAAITERDGGY